MAASQFLGGTCCTLVFSEEFLRPVENFPPCIPRRSVDVGFSDDFRARKIFHVFLGLPTQSWRACWVDNKSTCGHPSTRLVGGGTGALTCRMCFYILN
jgi:hypothetical protein